MSKNTNPAANKENVFAGFIGALLFSLAGGICWVVLYRLGYLAGISGLIGAICAIKGYSIFAKKLSVKGVVLSVIAALIVMVAAWYVSICWEISQDYSVPVLEAINLSSSYIKSHSETLQNLGIGLLLCIVGAFSLIKNALNSAKQAKAAAQAAAAVSAQAPVETAVEAPAEAAVEAPAEAAVEAPAEAAVEAPAEAAVEAPAEVPAE